MIDPEIIRNGLEIASIDPLVWGLIKDGTLIAASIPPAYAFVSCIVWVVERKLPRYGDWALGITALEATGIGTCYCAFFMPDMNNDGVRNINDLLLVSESIGRSIKELWYSFLHY